MWSRQGHGSLGVPGKGFVVGARVYVLSVAVHTGCRSVSCGHIGLVGAWAGAVDCCSGQQSWTLAVDAVRAVRAARAVRAVRAAKAVRAADAKCSKCQEAYSPKLDSQAQLECWLEWRTAHTRRGQDPTGWATS